MSNAKKWWVAINGAAVPAFLEAPLHKPHVSPRPELLIGFPKKAEAEATQRFLLSAPMNECRKRLKDLRRRKDIEFHRLDNPEPANPNMPTTWVEGEPEKANITLVSVNAYWHNDRPGGLGVGIDFQGQAAEEGVGFCEGLERCINDWDKGGATREDIEAQLSEIAARTGDLDRKATSIAIADIHWLERRGHLKADEHNGVLFAWTMETGNGLRLAMGEQNPVVIDLENAAIDGVDVTEISKAKGDVSGASLRSVLEWARQQKPGKEPGHKS